MASIRNSPAWRLSPTRKVPFERREPVSIQLYGLGKKRAGIQLKRKFTHSFLLSTKMAVNPRNLYELKEKLGQGFGVVSLV